MSQMVWNANLYDGKHGFVSELGSSIVSVAAVKEGEHVLDVGCGTGDWCQHFYEIGAQVTGFDSSPEMIEQAKEKYPHVQFHCVDATDIQWNKEFDVVFSNAALHWMKDAKRVVENIYAALRFNGRFVAEFGGKYNVQTIINAVLAESDECGYAITKEDLPWYFPSVGEYATLLESAGFTVAMSQHFQRMTTLDGDRGVAQWVEMFGPSLLSKVPIDQRTAFVNAVQKRTEEVLYREGTWYADYWRIQVVAIKEVERS
ncbi:MAG: class I SAM-dependent methyltransferase [Bacilli bacterium]